jgi:putative glutamine amidotransferase
MRKYLLFLIAATLFFCGYYAFLWNTPQRHKQLRIAVTKASGSQNYEKYIVWLRMTEPNAEYVDLSVIDKDSAMAVLEFCHGLVITGGHDIYPALYGREVDTSLCGVFDRSRDSLEIAALTVARNLKMPVLGICRGMQILNVFYGGSLFADIPIQFGTSVKHRCDSGLVCEHSISALPESKLQMIAGDSGWVNSFHHQGVRDIAPGFSVSALSADGFIEAIEHVSDTVKMMGVQWHPERMDSTNVFSSHISAWFLNNAMRYKQLKDKRKLRL